MPFSSLGDLIQRQARRAPYAHSLAASRVARAVEAWVTASWNQQTSTSVRVCYLRDGVLHIGVASASFAEALRWREGELRAHFRMAIPNAKIKGTHVFVTG